MSERPLSPALPPADGEKAAASGTPTAKGRFAWQPLTPRGVAAFGRASLGRLLLVQLIFAVVFVCAIVWFFQQAWFPMIAEAVQHLPAGGEIRAGQLNWTAESPQPLAEGHFLALAVDLKNEYRTRSPAQVEVVFGRSDFRIFSLLGFVEVNYPSGWRIAANRAELEPWWGAWKPAVSTLAIALLTIGLFLFWGCLATLYFLPAWLVGFFANRDLSAVGAWRVAGAALLPGTLFLAVAILCFGLGAVDVIRLMLAAAAHVALGWAYLLAGVLASPRHPEVASMKENPFGTQRKQGGTDG